jgi:hypothetical protein
VQEKVQVLFQYMLQTGLLDNVSCRSQQPRADRKPTARCSSDPTGPSLGRLWQRRQYRQRPNGVRRGTPSGRNDGPAKETQAAAASVYSHKV